MNIPTFSRNLGIACVGFALASTVPAWAEGDAIVELARGVAPLHPRQPQVALDAAGAIHVVYGVENRVAYCRSDDQGQKFSAPVELTFAPAMSLGMRRGPRVAAGPHGVCITAIGGPEGKGRDGNVLARHSNDGGKSWSEAAPVNDVKDSAREGLHALAAGPKGELVCVWLDLRSKSTEIYASTSLDGGRTWQPNTRVYRSPDGSVCECCHPSVAIDSRGRIHVLWRNSLAGDRDMYSATSTDGGQTFGAAAKWGRGTWKLEACPMDGGALAVFDDRQATVWRRERKVFLCATAAAPERELGPGEQPWVAMTREGPWTVWLQRRNEAGWLLPPDRTTPIQFAANVADPTIAAAVDGDGPVALVWEERHGNETRLKCQTFR